MWIIPNNLPCLQSFQCVPDMGVSNEDLNLLGLNLEQSLLSRSKPMSVLYWQRKWKKTPYLQHLFGQMLKPCQAKCFETEYQSYLPVIHVSRSVQQVSDKALTTQDTCGHTSKTTSEQCDLFDVSLKTCKDTSAFDC